MLRSLATPVASPWSLLASLMAVTNRVLNSGSHCSVQLPPTLGETYNSASPPNAEPRRRWAPPETLRPGRQRPAFPDEYRTVDGDHRPGADVLFGDPQLASIVQRVSVELATGREHGRVTEHDW